MQRRIVASLLALPLFLLASPSASAQTTTSSNAQLALQWLQCTQQQANGQIGSGGNPIARSSEVAVGLAAAGQQASAMHTGATSLAGYLTTAVSTDVGTNGELLLARASVADAGPVATVSAQLQAAKGTNGEYGSDIYSDELAIQAILAAHLESDAGWNTKLDQAQSYLVGQQIASGADAGAIANAYSKLFATTDAPAAFLRRPLTARGLSESAVSLLACPAAASASPTPHPTPTIAPVLAQTGAPLDGRPLLGGFALIALAMGFVLRPRRHTRSS
ncbi:MAG: hypothetical protein E6J16_03465 [Chloroflexota bacterium]|nr:MAG: hypothetical protein E6J16_03465 [Chloroflexota bacterium]